MSVYNEKLGWIVEAVNSILAQSYSDFELIIVIDNPNIEPAIKDYLRDMERTDPRITIILNPENIGLARSLNIALDCATGEYIARMDADDISMPERFEEEIRFLQKYNADVVSSGQINIDENGKEIDRQGVLREPETVNKLLKYANFIGHSTVMARIDAIRKMGGYRPFKIAQDYDLWLRMITDNYRFAVTEQCLLKYRRRSSGVTQRKTMEQYYTLVYQRGLFREREKYGKDSFSIENYERFLKTKQEKKGENRFSHAKQEFDSAVCQYKAKQLGGTIHLIRAFLILPRYTIDRMTRRLITYLK